jgi:hypothetical protein
MKRNQRTAAEGGSFVTADLEGFKNLKMSITGMNLQNLHYSEMEHSLLQFCQHKDTSDHQQNSFLEELSHLENFETSITSTRSINLVGLVELF